MVMLFWRRLVKVIAKFECMAKMRVRRLGRDQCGKGWTPFGIGIVEHGLAMERAGAIAAQGPQAAPEDSTGGSIGQSCRMLHVPQPFRKLRVHSPHSRNIETIQPDNRVGRWIAMIVPAPVGRENQVERMHRRPLTIDGGVGAAAFHDKAQRRLAVAVTGSNLARQDQLKSGIKPWRNRGFARKAGIFHHQHASFRLLGGYRSPARIR